MSANKTLDGRSFGQKLMSGAFIYTLISIVLGFGVGAVASSYIAGHYKNIAAQDISLMMPAFFIAAGCALVGVVLMLLLKPARK